VSRRLRRPRLLTIGVASGLLGAAILLGAGWWIPVKAGLAQYLLERAWTETRAGVQSARPWPWADTWPVARLSLPALDADWIVLSGASGRNLAFAPAHVDGSALPGSPGAMVVAGHRDTHFRLLEQVRPGMQARLEDAAGAIHLFRIARVEIVDVRQSRIRLDAATPMLVLTTCYPFDALQAGGPLRFVVTAVAVGQPAAGAPETVTQFMGGSSTGR